MLFSLLVRSGRGCCANSLVFGYVSGKFFFLRGHRHSGVEQHAYTFTMSDCKPLYVLLKVAIRPYMTSVGTREQVVTKIMVVGLRSTTLAMLLMAAAVSAADTVARRHGRNGGGRKMKLGRSSSQMDLDKLARGDHARDAVEVRPVVEVAALRGGFAESDDVHEVAGPVLVRFAVDCVHVSQYEDVQVGIVGGCPELGLWTNAVVMDSGDWPTWQFEVVLHENYRLETIEYKYVKVDSDGEVHEWEPGKNRYSDGMRRVTLEARKSRESLASDFL